MDRLAEIEKRYFRKVMAHPEGAIVHHGDCMVFSVGFCTCGLLHDLSAFEGVDHIGVIEKLYPKYWEENIRQSAAYDVALMHQSK